MQSGFIQLKEISDKEFNLFRDIIYKESGISLSDHKKALMQSRLMKRLRALKLNDFRDYYDFLQENYDEEIINLLNCITTNKTDFFREDKHFDFMFNIALPGLEQKQKKKIRIWSAGCSTGQEPYSIAITILNFYNHYKLPIPDIKILATDIDTESLNVGKEGKYRAVDLEDVDRRVKSEYFIKGSGEEEGFYRVKDYIKKMIFFRRLNLLDQTYPMNGKFEMIFCRNVIIYFDNVSRRRVFEKFHHYLCDDGYLFAGHSENIKTFFEHFKLIGNTIYIKE